MTIHPHKEEPQHSPPKPPSVVMPMTLLALAAIVGIAYAAFMRMPSSGSAPGLQSTLEGSTLAIAPIDAAASRN